MAAATVLSRCDSHQRLYWATPIRLHAHDIGAAWRSVEEESGRFVGGLARSASGFAARRRGCRQGGCSALLCSPRDPCEGFRGELYGQAAESCGCARRSVVLLTHSATGPLHKVRKRAARAGRRVLGRARVAH